MIIIVSGGEGEFKAFTEYLKGIGISHKYHYRKDVEAKTVFSIEALHIDLVSLSLVRDYVEKEKINVKFMLEGKEYDVVNDYEALRQRVKHVEETEKLTRDYHP